MPDENLPTKRRMDRVLQMNTDKPSYAQIGRVLGCSARHITSLVAAGHLTKGAGIQRIVSEWVEYQMGLAERGQRRG